MALSWSPWIVLDEEHADQLAPNGPGIYELKIDGAVMDYPSGKSAMIFYGLSDEERPTLKDAIFEDWLVPDKEDLLAAWSEYGELVWRFALEADPARENARRLESFVLRFGRPPWANRD